MKIKRYIGLYLVTISLLNSINCALANNHLTRENAKKYDSNDWVQFRTGITDGEETIYVAQQISANYTYEYMRTDYESPSSIIVDLLHEEAGFTSSVNSYIGLTEDMFKDDDAKTNYYYEVLKELITNDDFNNPNINTVENTYKDNVQKIIVNKVDNNNTQLKNLKSIDTSKEILEELGVASKTLKNLEGFDYFIIGCDSLNSFTDKISTLITLTENIDNKRVFLKKIQENNNNNIALKKAIDKILAEIDTAESKTVTLYFERADNETYKTLKTAFNEEMTELGMEATGYIVWKKSIDWTGFAMNGLFGIDGICEIYLKMVACAEIEEIMKQSIETDLKNFRNNSSVEKASIVIAEADYYKALELYAADLAIEYADVVKSKGLVTKFKNIANSDIKKFKKTAVNIKEMIANESFTDDEFKDLDTIISAMYKDDINPDFWAVPYINEAREKGLFDIEHGYTHSITRAEFCRLICFLLESKDYNINTLIKEKKGRMLYTPFGDTRYEYVDNVYRLGIINGLGNNTFNPLGNITRQEAAVILRKTAEMLGYEITTEFCDDNTIADWARESVEYCLANGIMYGKQDKEFAPQDNITKQEAISTILRLYNNEGKKENNYSVLNFQEYLGLWESSKMTDKWNMSENIPVKLYTLNIKKIENNKVSGVFTRNSTHFRDYGVYCEFNSDFIDDKRFVINAKEEWHGPAVDGNKSGIMIWQSEYIVKFENNKIYIENADYSQIPEELIK